MNDPITLHDVLVILGGASIGLVLSVPAFWLFLKWMNHRDMTRVDRVRQRCLRKDAKTNKQWTKQRQTLED
jgi:hypothetical protein